MNYQLTEKGKVEEVFNCTGHAQISIYHSHSLQEDKITFISLNLGKCNEREEKHRCPAPLRYQHTHFPITFTSSYT